MGREACRYDSKQSVGSRQARDAGNPGKAGRREMAWRAAGSASAGRWVGSRPRAGTAGTRPPGARRAHGAGPRLRASAACGCAYRAAGRGCGRSHVAAVGHALPIRSQPAGAKPIAVGAGSRGAPAAKAKCARHGRYFGGREDGQIYRRPACGRRFRNGPEFKYRYVPRPYIAPALMLPGTGMPVGGMQAALRHPGADMWTVKKTIERLAVKRRYIDPNRHVSALCRFDTFRACPSDLRFRTCTVF